VYSRLIEVLSACRVGVILGWPVCAVASQPAAAPEVQEAVMRLSRSVLRRVYVVGAVVGVVVVGLAAVSPAGASPRTDASLAAAMRSLDRSVAFAGTAWGLDERSHQVVVSVEAP
jgi:hypothetical protein